MTDIDTRLSVGSLFAGIGGIDLGLGRAGMTIRWHSEIDVNASRVLEHHWPETRNYGDITEITRLPAVDIVCGGFPCQDLSVAGRRAGLAGERSGLWWEFRRILDDVRPRWVIIENVPGLLSSNRGKDMGTLLWSLGQLGYGWAYRVLDAQWFGVAQRRRRVFIVGCLGDRRAPATVLFEPESSGGDSPPGRTAGQDVTTSLTGGLGSGGPDASHAQAGWLVPWLEVGARTNGDGGMHVAHTLRAEGHDASEDGTGRGTPLVAFNWQNGGNEGYAFTEDATGPLDTSQTKAVYSPEMAVRRLTPTECLRLQGFPDDWLDLEPPLSDSAKYRLIGNAVAVPVAEWIGNRIYKLEEAAP